jgi:CDP-diacylglycerol--serine O-phosphatidyltransferase
MKPKTPAQTIRDAQAQAKRILERARTEAHKIREDAKRRQGETIARVQRVGTNAREGAKHAARLFRVNLANTLTLLNGVFGFLSMLAAAQRSFLLAAVFILLGVLCDWLDGKAARAFGEESPLGRELDSLSDLITFGVAPAFLVVMIYPGFVSYAAGALFVLSAALRLGRFNVQDEKGIFFGIPTTTNGILLPAMIFLGAPTTWFPVYLFVFALLMNAPIRLKKVF